MKYRHLSLSEREILAINQAQGFSLRSIAKKLNRSQSSLTREIQRNINYGNEYFGNKYLPCKAQGLADKRCIKQRTKAPLKETLIWLFVREHLREPFNWTPEEISKRLAFEHKNKYICTESIYQYIYSKKARRYKLWTLLPNARKKRMKKEGRRVQRSGKIPGSISIDKRPKYIQKRVQFGHWETDNVIGKVTDKTALSVTVERVTRYTILSKVTRSASSKADCLVNRLLTYPPKARLTLTTDNGKENSYHNQIARYLSLKMYFAHAYHFWEKGTVENTNQRIRRFIPKGVSMDQVSSEYIKGSRQL